MLLFKCVYFYREQSQQESTKAKINKNKKPFICEVCDDLFYKIKDFKKHLLNHYKSHTYVCNLCKKSYQQKNTIQYHLVTTHNKHITLDDINTPDISITK